MARRANDQELLAGALLARIERWLELEGVFTILGFGDVELAGELDWEPGAGPRNCRQVDRERCGAGGMRSCFSTRRTVEAPTRYPRPSSSP